MTKVILQTEKSDEFPIPKELLKNKRQLTATEIYTLIQNRNTSSDPDWKNIWVSDVPGEFSVKQIIQSEFNGWVILGAIRPVNLRFHDLELTTGIYRSSLNNVVVSDDCVIHNVSYLSNYRIGERVMLFNVQEMSCTNHSKFGEGILKNGEPEDNRVWIGVGNENGERSVLPFRSMIPADAYLWSRYREDKALMQRFIDLTESGNSGELNTYGIVENDAVIKNCTLLKDVWVGSSAYIKGAFKLKNISVLSSEEEPTQIGEGVELVNGILGYGSRVFYQAVAVRFVIGRNCQVKYGARILNTILGDNSTVSCCELLNNLIFPFHEQHHNSSFLIASTIQGQSNIASAATIGSNHNSRSPDGEMIAGRGFWPGLCSDFKYDSRFASFVLVSKGSYQNELNITYPFSLVATSHDDCSVHIIPGYWFLYNMFAIVRNKFKFSARDKRKVKVQHIETNPFAPDTIQEVKVSIKRIMDLVIRFLMKDAAYREKMTELDPTPEVTEQFAQQMQQAKDDDERWEIAKKFLHTNTGAKILLEDHRAQKKYGGIVYKGVQGYKEYRRIIKYFAVEALMHWVMENNRESLTESDIENIITMPLYKKWLNVGGQVIPTEKIEELFNLIKSEKINNWDEVHAFYDECYANYSDYKARYALDLLEYLYDTPINAFTAEIYEDLVNDVACVSMNMLESSITSREKDFTDYFRSITFRNDDEKAAVLGTLQDVSFLKELKNDTHEFECALTKLFKTLISIKSI